MSYLGEVVTVGGTTVEGITVEELIEQLQKVKNKKRVVLSYDSSTPVDLIDDGVDENPIYL